MLQYLQPSSNAIQNMLIQQILTSPEQVYWSSYDATGQLIYIWYYTLTIFPPLLLSGRHMSMKPTICFFFVHMQWTLKFDFSFSLCLSLSLLLPLCVYFFDGSFVERQTSSGTLDCSVRLWGRPKNNTSHIKRIQNKNDRGEKERKLITE